MKLSMFVACEKLIVDATGLSSLIVLLQAVNIGYRKEHPIPIQTVAPRDWVLVAMWMIPSELLGRDLIQNFEILWPDGTEFGKTKLPFTPLTGRTAMNYLNINAMPIGQKGELLTRAWVETPEGEKLTEVHDHWISINHVESV